MNFLGAETSSDFNSLFQSNGSMKAKGTDDIFNFPSSNEKKISPKAQLDSSAPSTFSRQDPFQELMNPDIKKDNASVKADPFASLMDF